jgi:hypothetical protein
MKSRVVRKKGLTLEQAKAERKFERQLSLRTLRKIQRVPPAFDKFSLDPECYWCGLPFRHVHNSPWRRTREHIVPKTLGGSDAPENVAEAHLYCNTRRGHDMSWVPFEEHKRRGQRYKRYDGKLVRIRD